MTNYEPSFAVTETEAPTFLTSLAILHDSKRVTFTSPQSIVLPYMLSVIVEYSPLES